MSDYGDLVRHAFPDGTCLYYRDSDHSYWADCKRNSKNGSGWSGSGRLTGISTVVAPLDFRPDNLMRWVESLTLRGVAAGFADEPVPGDPHELRQALERAGLRWEQIRDEAGERGTEVHRWVLELLASGAEVPDLEELPPEQRGYAQAMLRWWIAREPEPLQVEQCVMASEHGCAGRLDLRYRITDRPLLKGSVGILDVKTGGYIPTKAHAQVAGYDLAAVMCGFGEEAAELVILQLRQDGTFDEYPVAAAHQDFLAALDCYRRSARIGKLAKAHREAIAAVPA